MNFVDNTNNTTNGDNMDNYDYLYNRDYKEVDHDVMFYVRIDPVDNDGVTQKATLFLDDIEVYSLNYTFCNRDKLQNYMDLNGISDTLVLPYDTNYYILIHSMTAHYKDITEQYYLNGLRYSYEMVTRMKLNGASLDKFENENSIKGFPLYIVKHGIKSFFIYIVNNLSNISPFIFVEHEYDNDRKKVEYYNNYQDSQTIFNLMLKSYQMNNFTYSHLINMKYLNYANEKTAKLNPYSKLFMLYNNVKKNIKPFKYQAGNIQHTYYISFKRIY